MARRPGWRGVLAHESAPAPIDAVPGGLVRVEIHDRGSVRLVEAVGRPGS